MAFERTGWEAAMSGWNAPMQDPATAGQVALAYMPLYQSALATYDRAVGDRLLRRLHRDVRDD
jgi:hypothetical protein